MSQFPHAEPANAPGGHDDLYARAERALATPAHGTNVLPKDARFIMKKGHGARFEDTAKALDAACRKLN